MSTIQPNTKPVAAQHAIDVVKLEQWLAASVGPLATRAPFTGLPRVPFASLPALRSSSINSPRRRSARFLMAVACAINSPSLACLA